MSKIGFIGLGHMGTPMAKNLLKHKYEVLVFDINSAAMDALVAEGAIAASPKEMAQQTDIIITMLQTGDQVAENCLGENGLFAQMKPNSLFIDSSSIDIKTCLYLHEEAIDLLTAGPDKLDSE